MDCANHCPNPTFRKYGTSSRYNRKNPSKPIKVQKYQCLQCYKIKTVVIP